MTSREVIFRPLGSAPLKSIKRVLNTLFSVRGTSRDQNPVYPSTFPWEGSAIPVQGEPVPHRLPLKPKQDPDERPTAQTSLRPSPPPSKPNEQVELVSDLAFQRDRRHQLPRHLDRVHAEVILLPRNPLHSFTSRLHLFPCGPCRTRGTKYDQWIIL